MRPDNRSGIHCDIKSTKLLGKTGQNAIDKRKINVATNGRLRPTTIIGHAIPDRSPKASATPESGTNTAATAMKNISISASKSLSSRIVINAATLETLHAAVECLKANGFASEVTLVNVARSKDILDLTRFEALNPVFIITGKREEAAQE